MLMFNNYSCREKDKDMIQTIKLRIANRINIIGWRLVAIISQTMINVNDWCRPAPHHEEAGYDV